MVQKFNPHIVIIGGGAGGLELATKLGDTIGKKNRVTITLVDTNLTHTWKPLWHEAAAGTLTSSENEIDYIVQAYRHHFRFEQGTLIGLKKAEKRVILASDFHAPNYTYEIPYDILVIAIGSVSNDFNIPGVNEHCYALDSYSECQRFHQHLIKNLLHLARNPSSKLIIAIVGAGATGVELAAELHFACQQALYYYQPALQKSPFEISLLEAAPRILAPLPIEIARTTQAELRMRKIRIYTNKQVVKIDATSIYTRDGLQIPAAIKIWTAGIKAPPVLSRLSLETNSRHQIIVNQNLQTVTDENIFAFGDCAFCPQNNSNFPVPPRAQAAHQQALLLAKSLAKYIKGKPLMPFYYRDYGSFISLSRRRVLGHLKVKKGGSIYLRGTLARIIYFFLYRRHQAALQGWWRVALLSVAQWLTKPVRSRLKLH